MNNTKNKILNFLGLNIKLKEQIKDIIIAIVFSYVLIFLIILAKVRISNYTIEDIKTLAINGLSISGTIIYGMYCFIQEILARGLLQRIIKKKTKNILVAILITTIVFCLCHYNYNIITIIGAFFISILTGLTTDKDDNIIRGFFMHWIIGGFGYVFLSNTLI